MLLRGIGMTSADSVLDRSFHRIALDRLLRLVVVESAYLECAVQKQDDHLKNR